MLPDSSGPSSLFHKQMLKNTSYVVTNRNIHTYKIWKAYDVFSHYHWLTLKWLLGGQDVSQISWHIVDCPAESNVLYSEVHDV